MIDRAKLLSDLQTLLKRLEADLLERSESAEVPDVGQTLHNEYDRAKKAERTAQNYEDWRSDYLTQTAAAWVLSCVFVRFLEDNKLIDPPKIAGPNERLQLARDEHTLYFQDSERAKLTDREYLLSVFEELAKLPGTKDVFGEHNPVWELPNWLSGDAAGELLRFFQKIDANTGDLIHDFTDDQWDTRFLGDLYQDLSEAARKKYALLQTPEFVEEFILDRTLDPAMEEFGLDAPPVTDKQGQPITEPGFRLIDPACGSGHFLLGAFPRILDRWQKQEPGGKIRDLVQKTLDCIHGVDVNPYAVAIARFRLLLVALRASHIQSLSDSPGFVIKVGCGDSLLHAPLKGGQKVLDFALLHQPNATDWDHSYVGENLTLLKSLLRSGIYHAVIANPPYIRPSDPGLNAAYRNRFVSCHGFYALTSPFMETIFNLSVQEGFTGQITGNSYMNNEFGKKLVQEFFPKIELTTVVDTKYITPEGHGTPTVILFGRRRQPQSSVVRCVVGLKGDRDGGTRSAIERIWNHMLSQVDRLGVVSEFFETLDIQRAVFNSHPWPITGSDSSNVAEVMASVPGQTLRKIVKVVGVVGMTNADDVLLAPLASLRRRRVESTVICRLIAGDNIRDWSISENEYSIFPYDRREIVSLEEHMYLGRWLWQARTSLGNRATFGNSNYFDEGRPWWGWHQISHSRLANRRSIVFAYKATHNHFVLNEGNEVFNRTAPVIKLSPGASDDTFDGIVGLLNSSIACFWERSVHRQVSGAGNEPWEARSERNATKIKNFFIPDERPIELSRQIRELSDELKRQSPDAVSNGGPETLSKDLDDASRLHSELRGKMVQLQEDLDWYCYRAYGLIDDDLTYKGEVFPVELGQRAFEIVLARKAVEEGVHTNWFERHDSTSVLDVIETWPEDYKRVVRQRMEVIATNPNIELIERPECKRRWAGESWDDLLEATLRKRLLECLEGYCDFDGRMDSSSQDTSSVDIGLTTVAKLTDVARQDSKFMRLGEVFRRDAAFNVERLVDELVRPECVPMLPVLRYSGSGLRKRVEWEETWRLQREEDSIDARTRLSSREPTFLTLDEAIEMKKREVGTFSAPPKFKRGDFINSSDWRQRGPLDVPKERWVSFPHCEGPDGTLVIAWAGYDHLQLARAISAYFVDIQERLGGRDDPRLVPLLACIIELLPWLKQWHHDLDPDYNQRMDEVFEGFVTEEAKNLGLTIEEIKAWEPPKKTTSRKRRRSTK